MRDIYNSPAADYFNEMNIVLAGKNTQDPVTREWDHGTTVFYLNPYIMDKSVNLGVYNDRLRKYEISGYFDDFESLEEALRDVDAKYPDKIDVDDILPMYRVFFQAAPGVISVEDKIGEDYECEYCGINKDDFDFLLVPAVPGTPLSEASLNLHWEFGCFGGESVNGVFSEVKDEALDLLQRMRKSAEKDYASSVKEAIRYLKQFEG